MAQPSAGRWAAAAITAVAALLLFVGVSPAARAATPDPSTLRLVPLELVALELGGTVNTGVMDTAVGRTRGFALAAQPTGGLQMRAEGEPFESVLGGTSATFAFDPAAAAWQLQTPQGAVRVQVNARFEDPASRRVVAWSGVTLCRAGSPACALFLLATAEQVCQLLTTGNFQSNPQRRQQALQALNAVNAQGITCAGP